MGWGKQYYNMTEGESRLWFGAGVKDERTRLAKDATSLAGGWGLKGRVIGPDSLGTFGWNM